MTLSLRGTVTRQVARGRRSRHERAFWALLVGLQAPPPTIWIVDAANGVGTNFTDLPAAVATAATGDTILIRPGTYSTFQVSGKALTLRGAGPDSTIVASPNAGSSATRITNTPTGHVFFLGGLRVAPSTAPALTPDGVLQVESATVTLADCVVTATRLPIASWPRPALRITQGEVWAERSRFSGGSFDYLFGISGSTACTATDSVLVATECLFAGANTPTSFRDGAGGPGLILITSTAALHACSLTGGNGSFYASAGEGLRLTSTATARIVGSSSDVISTGSGFSSSVCIRADGTSAAYVHGNPTLVVPTTGPTVAGSIQFAPMPLPRLHITASRFANGEIQPATSLTVSVDGQLPAAPVLLGYAAGPQFSTAYAPLTLGEAFLPIQAFQVAVALDATGRFTHHFPASIPPAILGAPVFGQVAVLDVAAATVRMSNVSIDLFAN